MSFWPLFDRNGDFFGCCSVFVREVRGGAVFPFPSFRGLHMPSFFLSSIRFSRKRENISNLKST